MTTPTITRSPVTSGRITQLAAGGVNGFSTSHEAASRSTIGAPRGDRQPPRLLVEGELLGDVVADVAAQDRDGRRRRGGRARRRCRCSASRISSSAAPASTGSSSVPTSARDTRETAASPLRTSGAITARLRILGPCA